jgi:hypothetical protein
LISCKPEALAKEIKICRTSRVLAVRSKCKSPVLTLQVRSFLSICFGVGFLVLRPVFAQLRELFQRQRFATSLRVDVVVA